MKITCAYIVYGNRRKKSTARKKDKEKGNTAEYKTQTHTQKKAARQKRKKLMDVFVLFFGVCVCGKKEEKTPKNKDCARAVFCAKQ